MTTNFIKFTQNIQKLLSTSQKSYLMFNNSYPHYKIHARYSITTTKFTKPTNSLQCIWNLQACQLLRSEINRKQIVCNDTNKVHINIRSSFFFSRHYNPSGFRPAQLLLSILGRKVLQSADASGTSNPQLRGEST
jgi:hypothetical protein